MSITLELSPQDRKLLENFTGAITLLATVLGNTQPAEVQEKIVREIHNTDHPADASTAHLEPVEETPAPAADPDPVEETPEVAPVSFAEFQKAVTQTVAKGPKQKAAAREVINKYAASVSEVPEDKRAEVMAELAKI